MITSPVGTVSWMSKIELNWDEKGTNQNLEQSNLNHKNLFHLVCRSSNVWLFWLWQIKSHVFRDSDIEAFLCPSNISSKNKLLSVFSIKVVSPLQIIFGFCDIREKTEGATLMSINIDPFRAI